MTLTNRGAALVLALTATALYLAGTVATNTPSDIEPRPQFTPPAIVTFFEDGSARLSNGLGVCLEPAMGCTP